MKTTKILIVVCISLVLIVGTTAGTAQADCCDYFNPLLLPFAVAGAAIGTAASIVTGVVAAPVYGYPGYYDPYYYYPPDYVYYGPSHYRHSRVWVRGHYDRYGYWVPGYWHRY